MPSTKMILINSDYLRAALSRARLNHQMVGEKIGRSPGYISQCLRRGDMSRRAALLLSATFPNVIELKRLERTDESETLVGMNANSYDGAICKKQVGVEIQEEKVLATYTENGETKLRAFAKIRGSDTMDLLQAVSYSTHMLYKLAEQESLAEDKTNG